MVTIKATLVSHNHVIDQKQKMLAKLHQFGKMQLDYNIEFATQFFVHTKNSTCSALCESKPMEARQKNRKIQNAHQTLYSNK